MKTTFSYVSLLLVFKVLLFYPLQAQMSEMKIDELRTNIQESFVNDLVIQSTALIDSAEDIPRHLLVRGYTMPSNYFVIRIPVDDWNDKIFMDGCGVGCGTLPTDINGKLKIALLRGYATATMNTGHWSPHMTDMSWAYNNPQAEKDFSYRAVHETLRATQEVVKQFFNRESKFSYFWGCSTGGRQAAMAAARYPADFDGVISEGPVLNWTDLVQLHVWFRQTNTGPDGKDIITKDDLPIISKAVYAACDGLDGKADGLINNPSNCQFEPELLLCQDDENCLSREKVAVLKKWYRGPVDSNGESLLSSGIPLGSEPFWTFWFLGDSEIPFDEFIPVEGFVQYTAFKEDPGESYSVYDFDFDTDPERMAYMGELFNVDHLSLNDFQEAGGKMLMFHGAADPVIPYQFSVDYHGKAFEEFGESTNDFFRLFLVPGMDHCTAFSNLGITGDSVDPLTALESWVEKNQPPEELSVIRFNSDNSVKSQFKVSLHVVPDNK